MINYIKIEILKKKKAKDKLTSNNKKEKKKDTNREQTYATDTTDK